MNKTNSKTVGKEILHKMPVDLRKVIAASSKTKAAWAEITPLAKNEWICWITSPKKAETRRDHINRTCAEIIAGKRRPCCWAGCPHR